MGNPAVAVTGLEASERRSALRFPTRQDCRYRVLRGETDPLIGVGRTVNISRTGVLFTTEARLPVGEAIELVLDWTPNGQGKRPKIVVSGWVVRVEDGAAAVAITEYRFQTAVARAHGA